MEGSPFLPLPEGMLIDQIEQTDSQLTVTVISTRDEAACPGCGCPSEHVHSQYQRTVNDVPCGGRNVVLQLHVRKFFCLQLCCPHKVFAERLPDLVQPWANTSLADQQREHRQSIHQFDQHDKKLILMYYRVVLYLSRILQLAKRWRMPY